jgi:uncharacterized protein with HEPN domain
MKAYASEAIAYVGDRSDDELANDRLRLLGVTRAAEIVGEAASQLPRTVRDNLPNVEFAAAIAMRNRLIHGYGSLSVRILAETIRHDFPRLVAALELALAGSLPDEPT